MTRIAQILVAAGKGARFQGDIPKQYVKLRGKTILRHTLDNLLLATPNTESIVIVHAKDDAWVGPAISGHKPAPICVIGGETRAQSVRAGMLALVGQEPDIVFVHDAARPFVSKTVMQSMIEILGEKQAVAPVLPVVDAVKTIKNKKLGEDVERANIRRIQTPQGFRFKDIWPYYQAMPEDEEASDDIAIARKAGLSIGTVDGDEKTFKITFAEDLEKARQFLETDTYMAAGTGFDVHRTEPGDFLWLCGVKITAGFTLKGHSDADVGLHALTDAIYGALAEGDIGDHFPPTDAKWKGVASHIFLEHAQKLTQERGGIIQHVDITLICEQPKVKPHRTAMRTRVAEILDLPVSRVSIKATTTEKLGFTGRGEGIAAQASATVKLPAHDR